MRSSSEDTDPISASASARALAAEALRRVIDGGAYSSRVVPALLRRSRLGPADRRLASELAYGTLRRRLPIDRALASLTDRPLEDASPAAAAALRVGAYQLLETRIPDHAAVAETVALVSPPERGFVNAVLRRLARERPEPPAGNDDEAVALRTGLASWAVGELRQLLGDEAEPAAAGLAAPGGLTLRANPCRGEVDALARELREAGANADRGRIHGGSLRLRGGEPAALPGYADGRFAVQDEASAWVVDVLGPRPGHRVLDVCAGPGGKALDIACRAGGVVAADLSFRRALLIRKEAARLGGDPLLLAQDGARPALRPEFDLVLVDAPCSGVGAARRRPELLWRPRREALPGLVRLQRALLAAAATLLVPGGVLVYSVCTFPRDETDGVCDAALAERPELRPDPFATPDGTVAPRARLWPHRHGTDAMFAARFVRTGSRPATSG